jgi:hypothetical protein
LASGLCAAPRVTKPAAQQKKPHDDVRRRELGGGGRVFDELTRSCPELLRVRDEPEQHMRVEQEPRALPRRTPSEGREVRRRNRPPASLDPRTGRRDGWPWARSERAATGLPGRAMMMRSPLTSAPAQPRRFWLGRAAPDAKRGPRPRRATVSGPAPGPATARSERTPRKSRRLTIFSCNGCVSWS